MIKFETAGRTLELSPTLRMPGRVRTFGAIRQSLSVLSNSEASNASVTLDNSDGGLSDYFRLGRLVGAESAIYSNGVELFTGRISNISEGESITLAIEAGGLYHLFESLPLRRAANWGEYIEDATLPVVYSSARVTPVRYNPAGTKWVVADGPAEPAAAQGAVYRDGELNGDYAARREVDKSGKAVSLVELGSGLVSGETLSVIARGYTELSAVTGQPVLVEDVAGIITHLMTEIVGAPVGNLGRLRRDTAGIKLAGAFVTRDTTVQGALDAIVGSVGGVWASGMPGFARLYPKERQPGEPIRYAFTPRQMTGVSASHQIDNITTELQVSYGLDYADSQYDGAIIQQAGVKRFGVRQLTLGWPFARSASFVLSRATEILQYLARPRVVISFSTVISETTSLRLGDWVTVSGTLTQADDVELFVTSIAVDPYTGKQDVLAEAPLGVPPPVTLVSVASRFESPVLSPAVVTAQGSTASFTIKRPDTSAPLIGALVTLDGTRKQRITDGRGQVQFTELTVGSHSILVEHALIGVYRFDWVQGG